MRGRALERLSEPDLRKGKNSEIRVGCRLETGTSSLHIKYYMGYIIILVSSPPISGKSILYMF